MLEFINSLSIFNADKNTNILFAARKIGIIFGCFLFFLIGGSAVFAAEDSKSFDGKSKIVAQQDNPTSDKNSSHSPVPSFESAKVFGEGKGEAKAKELDFNQSEFTYAFIKDIKKSDPIGFVGHPAENLPQERVNKSRQFDSLSSNKLPFMSNMLSSDDSYEGINKNYGDGYNFSDRFRDGIRAELGEDVYEKAVWTYTEIKDLDDWINSTVAQYGFDEGSQLGKQKYSIVGLDGLLNVMAVFHQNDGIRFIPESDGNKFLGTEDRGDKVLLSENYQDRFANVQVRDSKFAIIFKYLSLVNLAYFFSFMIFFGIIARGFKILVREQ